MKDFDLKKFLAKNPLKEAYTPGSGWTQDFDYDDMLAHGLKLNADSPLEDLEKVAADFEDVNYHREAEPLFYAIDAIKAGDRGEAKMYINKFHAEVKKTIADYSDEYFDVNEAQGGKFDVETTTKIAQKVADAFTAEDDLDLKYVVSPDVEESSFNLDVEAGPNTPGEDWKDANGFGIENYLGKYAGGSFYIKDGVVVNAAMRSAKVANVNPEGEVEMISAEDSRADLDAIDAQRKKETQMANVFVREENKSNKMKKSELKEMIRQAMLAETTIEETQDSEVLAMTDMIMDALGAEKFVDELILAMDTDEAKANLEHIIRMHDLGADMGDREDMPGFEGTYDALDNLKIREADEEEVDVEADAEETADAEVATDDVTVDDTETTDVEATAEISPEVKATQDALTAAIEAAKALGDQKLADQIGNSITFFTRTHVVGQDKVAENVDLFSMRMLKNAGIKK